MKPRKQLNKGDKVRFFGYYKGDRNTSKEKSQNYYTVIIQENDLLCLETLESKDQFIYIDRRQVTHVKIKKIRREFYARKCEISSHDSSLQTAKIHIVGLLCSSCKIIKVREVKE